MPFDPKTFSKNYFDLLRDFKSPLAEIVKKLKTDASLQIYFESVKGCSSHEAIEYSIFYDFYQILSKVCKDRIEPTSLETFGLVLIAGDILSLLAEDALQMDSYESLRKIFQLDKQVGAAKSIIRLAEEIRPIEITSQNHQVVKNGLMVAIVLKLTKHKHFDEYANLLYRFATIIAKADNLISDDEKVVMDDLHISILRDTFHALHQPINEEERYSLKSLNQNSSETLEEVIEELEGLIGLVPVKQEVRSLVNYIKIQKEREKHQLKTSPISYHSVFIGSPGTGKTTIARIIAKVYKHLGVLKSGHLVETDRAGLIAEYSGQTAVKTNKVIDAALDGILFIDEAYSLVGDNGDDFGKEALAALIKRMEDDRSRLIIILAGYTEEMKKFISINPGLNSRFNRFIEFADYSPNELAEIFKVNCNRLDYILTNKAEEKLNEIVTEAYIERNRTFGNGRFARNLFEKAIENQANRIAELSFLDRNLLLTIEADDL